VVVSVNEVDLIQQIVGSSFLIQFASHCLLMEEFSPLTVRVSIDKFVVIPVI
jgi:hypothetical protein